jgi:hypothetical protein
MNSISAMMIGLDIFLYSARKALLLAATIALFVPMSSQGQDTTAASTQNWKVSFSGFLKSDYWYDSREIVGARDNLLLFYPAKPDYAGSGEDFNAHSSLNFSMITSRITARIAAPDAFGAKTSGVLEADFSGISNNDIDGFRMRHSYIEMQWKKAGLLLGQYWHPMFVPEVFPNVLALNTGAPFQPFIRSPQLSFTWREGGLNLLFSALTQLDYASEGPAGRSTKYLRDAGIPNLHMQASYRTKKLLFGGAVDFKSIVPQIDLIEPSESEQLTSISYMAYGKFVSNGLNIKAKVILGENLTEHLMLGGYYAVQDPISGMYEDYRPSRHLNTWLNLTQVVGRWEFSGFFGYAKKLSEMKSPEELTFGRNLNIDHVYRIAPLVAVSSGKLKFYCEAEYTLAAYESYTGDAGNVVTDIAETPGNLRIQLSAFLFF